MPTKKSKHTRLVKHESNLKAIVSFLILAIAAAVFYLFMQYKDYLVASPELKFFVVLVVVLFMLLISLLFLVNPQRK